jgi:hypothetical protein
MEDSPSESTRNSSCTTLNTGEQGIQDSLTSKQGVVGGKLLGDRSRSSDRPKLHELVLSLFTLELGLHDDILVVSWPVREGLRAYIDSVRTLLDNVGDCSHCPWG